MDALSIPARRMRRGPVPPRTNFCSQRALYGGGMGVRALYIAAPCHPVPGQGEGAGRYATLLLLASVLSKLSVHPPATLHRTRLHNARSCVRRLTLWLHARCPQDGQEVFFKIKKTAKLGKVRMLLRRRRWLGVGRSRWPWSLEGRASACVCNCLWRQGARVALSCDSTDSSHCLAVPMARIRRRALPRGGSVRSARPIR